MTGVSHQPLPPSVDPEAIAAFRDAATATISDNLGRLPGMIGLRPFHRGGKLVGTALTVRVRAGDNLAIHQALDVARGGDVLVIDGAIRDSDAFLASDFPCDARAAIHRGPYTQGPGAIDVPASVGSWVVEPGDVGVGDLDGVVSFPSTQANALIVVVQAQEARGAKVLQMIRELRHDRRNGKVARG